MEPEARRDQGVGSVLSPEKCIVVVRKDKFRKSGMKADVVD